MKSPSKSASTSADRCADGDLPREVSRGDAFLDHDLDRRAVAAIHPLEALLHVLAVHVRRLEQAARADSRSVSGRSCAKLAIEIDQAFAS